MKMLHLIAVCALLAASGQPSWAGVFSMPNGQKSLEFVAVADQGNQPDVRFGTPNHGVVGYIYQMGKYDTTAAQYCQFLNAVANQSDPYGLYNPYMSNTNANPRYIGCGIIRSGELGGYTYSVLPGRENIPVNYVSWADAARFCNWLSNGQPAGLHGPATTETGSYTLNGAMDLEAVMAVQRNPGATYVIPSEEEWYKAAYYKGGSTDAGYWLYPTKSSIAPSNILSSIGTNNANYYEVYSNRYTDPVNYVTPVGAFAASPGPYGTYDMGGNVAQWNESSGYDALYNDGWYRGTRGGSALSYVSDLRANAAIGADPRDELNVIGFRVVQVPEPASLSLLALGGLLIARRRRA